MAFPPKYFKANVVQLKPYKERLIRYEPNFDDSGHELLKESSNDVESERLAESIESISEK